MRFIVVDLELSCWELSYVFDVLLFQLNSEKSPFQRTYATQVSAYVC